MTNIQRYEPWPQEWPMEDANGDLVTYEDHVKIVQALKTDLAELVDAAEGVIPAALYYGGLTDAHLAAITRLETIIATVSKAHQIKRTTK